MSNKFQNQLFTLATEEKVIIREGREEDASQILELGKSVIGESEFQVTLPSEFNMTIEQETEWIRSMSNDSSSLLLLAECNNKIIGILDFHANSKRIRLAHTGHFGISVDKNFRDQGIGRAMLEFFLEWARLHPIIEKVSLAVLSHNERAIHLYKKLGFIEEGRKVKEVKIDDNTYVDDVLMYQEVNSNN